MQVMMHDSYSCDVRSIVLQYFNNKFVNEITDICIQQKTSTEMNFANLHKINLITLVLQVGVQFIRVTIRTELLQINLRDSRFGTYKWGELSNLISYSPLQNSY
jgi:hypothetical protein